MGSGTEVPSLITPMPPERELWNAAVRDARAEYEDMRMLLVILDATDRLVEQSSSGGNGDSNADGGTRR